MLLLPLELNCENICMLQRWYQTAAPSTILLPQGVQVLPTDVVYKLWHEALPKKHFCLYCDKGFSKIARHLEQRHSTEFDVVKALSFDKNSKNRQQAWSDLRNRGNFNHNYSCREQGEGLLVPKYRSRKDSETLVEDYTTCSTCFGLYVKRRLWLHQKTCQASNTTKQTYRKEGIKSGQMLDPVALEDKVFRDSILIDMNNDPIKKCVEDDSLIMEFGRWMLQKHREPHKKAYVANKCRELGRLLLDGKQKHGWKKLEDAVDPKHFEKLIQSVQVVAGFDQTTARFESPSTALKLGYSLTNCCAIVKCRALRESDKALKDKCSNFQELYANEWHDRISSQAHRTLHTITQSDCPLLRTL